jgi:hypothetical protein
MKPKFCHAGFRAAADDHPRAERQAEATDARPLHDDKGEINGLPLQSGVIGSTNEVAFSDTLKT